MIWIFLIFIWFYELILGKSWAINRFTKKLHLMITSFVILYAIKLFQILKFLMNIHKHFVFIFILATVAKLFYSKELCWEERKFGIQKYKKLSDTQNVFQCYHELNLRQHKVHPHLGNSVIFHFYVFFAFTTLRTHIRKEFLQGIYSWAHFQASTIN